MDMVAKMFKKVNQVLIVGAFLLNAIIVFGGLYGLLIASTR